MLVLHIQIFVSVQVCYIVYARNRERSSESFRRLHKINIDCPMKFYRKLSLRGKNCCSSLSVGRPVNLTTSLGICLLIQEFYNVPRTRNTLYSYTWKHMTVYISKTLLQNIPSCMAVFSLAEDYLKLKFLGASIFLFPLWQSL